jgi:tetratricopeptide (TPR) repeat protein
MTIARLYFLLCFVLLTHTSHAGVLAKGITPERVVTDTILSPLTDVEVETLSQAYLARNGEADALLSLAILASGDVRHFSDYQRIRNRIQQFINKMRPKIKQEKNDWKKGYLLFSAMHDEFLSPMSSQVELKGYRAEQSQFNRIFKDKTYNCVSSSILYLILAQYFNMNVEAVILPSHSFVQLTTRSGKVIEIETTTKSGFGLRHNREFYTNKIWTWSQARNLSPVTYEDYLNRSIVSTFDLIADNMNHQHTSSKRMSRDNRNRLNEIRAWLLPNNEKAQLNRLYVFNNELIRFRNKKDKDNIKQLLLKAQPLINNYAQKLASEQTINSDVYNIMTFFYASAAEVAIANSDLLMAVDYYQQALRWEKSSSQQQKLQQNIVATWLNHGNTFFSDHKYKQAIAFYERALAAHRLHKLSESDSLKQTLDNNIASAYWNLSVPLLNKGNSYEALELMQQCLQKHPALKPCQQKITTICDTYTLPACQR